MVSPLDYAALSAVVYNDVREQDNKLPIPELEGWTQLPFDPGSSLTSSITGFVEERRNGDGARF